MMIRSTTGARVTYVILGMAAVMILLAVTLSSLLGNKEPTVPAASPSKELSRIIPINWSCSSSLAEIHSCAHALDGQGNTYWSSDSSRGQGAKIEVTFAQPYALQTIVFKNVTDDEEFATHYKVEGFRIDFDDLPDAPFIDQLDDSNEPQLIAVMSFSTTQLTFNVTSAYEPQSPDGKTPYDELVIAEIEFWGQPTN